MGPGSEQMKQDKIIEATAKEHERLTKEVLDDAKQRNNPIADQVISGARGSPANLKRLIGGDLLYVDHRDNVVPFPVQSSYAEGLKPAEYWAGTYGARKGLIDVKFATQDAGFFAKQLNQLAHRLMVTRIDDDEVGPSKSIRGLPVATSDPDNEGALLAHPAGKYPRNTVLTPKILKELDADGVAKILVRSPTVGGPNSGGVYARDVGIREKGRLAPIGDMVGIAAAQALSERLTQGQLGSKHSGGVKGEAKSVSGFEHVNQLVQVPETFKGGAAHSQVDGHVTDIHPAPTGGQYVTIAGQRHYVGRGFELKVKRGDTVEAGDMISEGIPNPQEIVKHKGIGEGRRYFTDAFSDAYRNSGMPFHRRNVELVARGLINHVELTDEDNGHVAGDIVPYQELESKWIARDGTRTVPVNQAKGKYLEAPVLHYTIGTPMRPSVLKTLNDFGVKNVDVHDDPPPFAPHMLRAMASAQHDPDWMTRFLGGNQKSSLLRAVHRGATSDTNSTSFVPALAAGTPFGTDWPKSVLRQPGS
jgi:DNA-directed RNA polymerase subunit beta'